MRTRRMGAVKLVAIGCVRASNDTPGTDYSSHVDGSGVMWPSARTTVSGDSTLSGTTDHVPDSRFLAVVLSPYRFVNKSRSGQSSAHLVAHSQIHFLQ
jgi:hypothetical protein